MNTLNVQLAQALMADREREFAHRARRREARLTRPSTTQPAPSGRRTPGLLARLVPSFGARVRTA